MLKKIKKAAREYFDLLNMNPDTIIIGRKNYTGEEPERKRVWINILLFAATLVTTTLSGIESGGSAGSVFLSGLPFSLTLIAILLSHEMGHYFAARHFGVKASLPYFIPFPSFLLGFGGIGTMGAVIKIKSPICKRKDLLYIGAMGPIAGFIVSLIASIAGIYLSDVKPIPPPSADGMNIFFGDSILTSIITTAIHGRIPAGFDIYLSPYAWAGWIGFLITSLNLMPIGQLDGSRVVYALLGRKQLLFGWAAFAGLIVLSFIWIGWVVWVVLSLVLLKIGHPPVYDTDGLSTGEKAIAWICIIIFLLTFMPLPVDFR
ncbi:MAG: site-2 protease family protein [Spirochaetota bacterium]